MNFSEQLNISYPRPTSFTDAYDVHSLEHKNLILGKAANRLNIEDFKAIFAPRPMGCYQESVYFLPELFYFIFSQYQEQKIADCFDFQQLLNYLFIWITSYSECLEKDDLMDKLDNIFADFFSCLTKKFTIIDVLDPDEMCYIDSFFDYLKPKGQMMEYLQYRFTSLVSYDDYAWLIYLLILSNQRGYRCSFLEELKADKSWANHAVTMIIAETEKRPELTRFWSIKLDQAMIF